MADETSGLRYRAVTIKTEEGLLIDVLRDETEKPTSEYYFLFSDLPAIKRRMEQLGVKVVTREVLPTLVKEGYVRTWN